MPRLNDPTMDVKNIPNGSFNYSAVKINNLGATEYTLITIVQDISGSVNEFKSEMEDCLKEIVKACLKSPRADNLLLRFLQFGSDIDETHGFKLLSNCNPDDYIGILKIKGMTALYDASENAVTAIANYAENLNSNDFDVNGIVFIITDGMDNESTATMKTIKDLLKKTMQEENLESLITILIGVGTKNYPDVSKGLLDFKNTCGLTQYIELKDANSNTLAKLADFISRSISSQSQALGTGGPSKQVQLTF